MLMSKKDMKASITLGAIITIVLAMYVIVAIIFFTKENMIQDTITTSQTACVQRQIANQSVEQAKSGQQEKSNLKENTRVEETQKIVSRSSNNNEKNASEKNTSESRGVQAVQKKEEIQNVATKVEKVNEATKQESTTTIEKIYQGLPTVGKIEIPKTNVNMPIMESVTAKGMEIAPCSLFSTGTLNQKGNTLIVGHNYNNIFTNNKKLQIGDKIYITTLDGKRVEYVVYRTFKVNPEELDYVMEDSNNVPKIMLSTCTSSDKYRLVVMAQPN